ncbi:RIMS-binding protein 2-like [Scleropages formosus]|uniref:RIMS-binding protein 2-like n=1 Tax=Scleropages formosus TaxID=113540 RepID=UPI0010FA9D18|nr:RIMS-binding protein 2-like [Scleropages formosus]
MTVMCSSKGIAEREVKSEQSLVLNVTGVNALRKDQRLHAKLENLEQVLKHMREVAERRQQLEFEHEQALAILTFKQDEVKRLQRAQFAAKKEHEGVVQMLESTLDSMQAKVLELEEKCRNQSKQFSLLSHELGRFRLQAEHFDHSSGPSLSNLELYQLTNGVKDPEAMPSIANSPLGTRLWRADQMPLIHHRELPTISSKSGSMAEVPKLHGLAPKAAYLQPSPQKAFPPQGAHSVQQLEEPKAYPQPLLEPSSGTPFQVFIARYSYNPYDGPNDRPDLELPLTAGEYVYIYGDMDKDGFYKGELGGGRRGLVPSTFVEPVVQNNAPNVGPPGAIQKFGSYSQKPQDMESPDNIGLSDHSSDILDVAFEPDIEEANADIVPYPRRLTVIKQLARSVIIGWEPPLVPAGWGDVFSYNVFVDSELRLSVPFGSQTKAVLERLDVQLKTYRISVESVTTKGTSDRLRCSFLVGRDVCVAPTQLRVDHITATSASLTWLPSNSNYLHMVSLNDVEWQLVKAGSYSLRLTNLQPYQCYRVKVEGRAPQTPWELPPHRREHRSTTITFTTLIAGPPEAPLDVRVEAGPSPGIALISWLPVFTDAAGASNGAQVTGYTIYADKRKVLEVSSPTASSALMGPSQIHTLVAAGELTVRTMSPHGESTDSVPAQILPDLLTAITVGGTQTQTLGKQANKVPTLLRNPPLGAPANSFDASHVMPTDSSRILEGSLLTLPPCMNHPMDFTKDPGHQGINHLPASESTDQTMLITQNNISSGPIQSQKFSGQHQGNKIHTSPLPDIQEEEEPYSDNPGEENSKTGSRPDPCETDSDEEVLERLMKLPWQFQSRNQLSSIAEVTEEEDDIQEQDESRKGVCSPQIQQLVSRLEEISVCVQHQAGMMCQSGCPDPVGGGSKTTISKQQISEDLPVNPGSQIHAHGDQSDEKLGGDHNQHRHGSVFPPKNKPQRRVHYSNIVESISYQEEDSDYSVETPVKEVRRLPEKVRRSYLLETSDTCGNPLRKEIPQKTLMASSRPPPGQYLGSKTVLRTKAHGGCGMEISLEYGTEDDDESLLGDTADVVVEQMCSEWWLDGGTSEILRQLRSYSRHQEPQTAPAQQCHHRRGRVDTSGTKSSYKGKVCNRKSITSCHNPKYKCAKPEQGMTSYRVRDDHQRETNTDAKQSLDAAASAHGRLCRPSMKRMPAKTRRRLEDGLRLASPEPEEDLEGLNTKTRIFVALFPYNPAVMSPNPDSTEEELAFMEGQIIEVYGDKDVDGFYYGESNGQFGYVPCNLVSEIQVEDEETRHQLLLQGFLPTETPLEKIDTCEPATVPQALAPHKMVAMFDYDPRESSPNVDTEAELTFSAGDIIYVYGDMDEDGFFYGELNGHQGLVPSNFLQVVPETGDEARWDPEHSCVSNKAQTS